MIFSLILNNHQIIIIIYVVTIISLRKSWRWYNLNSTLHIINLLCYLVLSLNLILELSYFLFNIIFLLQLLIINLTIFFNRFSFWSLRRILLLKLIILIFYIRICDIHVLFLLLCYLSCLIFRSTSTRSYFFNYTTWIIIIVLFIS